MALVSYSQQNDYDLVHGEQDIRGWTVYDEAGQALGAVEDLIVDTDTEYVTALILTGGRQIPADVITIGDERVTLQGGAASMPDDAATARRTADLPPRASAEEVTLPVIEEQLNIGKREVERGGVRVRQRVIETPVEETISLREEHVSVDRRPVDRAFTQADVALQEGTIEVTESAEEAVVGKHSRVVEEVTIGKEVTEREETVRDTVRRTDIDVQEMKPDVARPAKQR